MPHACTVCSSPTISPRHRYCSRCYRFTSVRKEIRARVAALRAALDPSANTFACHYSGAPLDESDNKSPFFLCFDHRTPGKRHDLVACASLFNLMKSDMDAEEFRAVVRALAERFRSGAPFDPGTVKFRHWHRTVRPGRPRKPPTRAWNLPSCLICGKPPVPRTKYCSRCHRHADTPGFSAKRRAALRAAYDPVRDGFLCHYTGVKLDEGNDSSPWFLNYDHLVPEKGGDLVVAANFINVMKSELAEGEFRAVVLELDRYLRTGEPFRKDITVFEHWHGLSRARR